MGDSKAERESDAETRRAAWIIAVLRPELVIATVWRPIESSFRMTDEVYRKRGSGDFTLFCDRLLDASGRLVGFEMVPLPANPTLLSALRPLKYAELVGEEGCFRIFIATPSGPVSVKADQAFGGGVFESREGQFALVFPAYFLQAADWTSVPNGRSDGIEIEIPLGGSRIDLGRLDSTFGNSPRAP